MAAAKKKETAAPEVVVEVQPEVQPEVQEAQLEVQPEAAPEPETVFVPADEVVNHDPNEMCLVHLPYDARSDNAPVYINIGNHDWLIARDEDVYVPYYVKKALMESQEADKASSKRRISMVGRNLMRTI